MNAREAVFALLLAAAMLIPNPCKAGDYAERTILGFSPDGRYFVFEQFGRQDGSGFPYADIFFIDTSNDSWLEGTPINVKLDDEQAGIERARRDAMAKASGLIEKLRISEYGRVLASNPPSELDADPHKVAVNTLQVVPPSVEAWTFTLAELPIPAKRCEGIADTKGFRLAVGKKGAPPQVWHADKSIPESRGCPLRYAISDVVMHQRDGGLRTFAVLVSVFSFGFEGPDRRFIAVARQEP